MFFWNGCSWKTLLLEANCSHRRKGHFLSSCRSGVNSFKIFRKNAADLWRPSGSDAALSCLAARSSNWRRDALPRRMSEGSPKTQSARTTMSRGTSTYGLTNAAISAGSKDARPIFFGVVTRPRFEWCDFFQAGQLRRAAGGKPDRHRVSSRLRFGRHPDRLSLTVVVTSL